VSKKPLPTYSRQARPQCVPPELLALPGDSQIRFIDNVGTRIYSESVVTVADLLEIVRDTIKQQSEGYFTIYEAAQVLSDATGSPTNVQIKKLLLAIESKEFHALDVDDKRPVIETVSNYASVVRASDLIEAGFLFPGWPVAPVAVPPPAQTIATPAPVVAASDGPTPLTRNEIANCFAGLRGWDEKRWKSELSSPDDWLQACQQRKGTRGHGGYESTWWPVCIAVAMIDRSDTTARLVSSKFKTMESLKPWREAWEIHCPEAI
jgi:hypothetical protein